MLLNPLYHYSNLQRKYLEYKNVTTNKNLLIQKTNKTISFKNSQFIEIKIYIGLMNKDI